MVWKSLLFVFLVHYVCGDEELSGSKIVGIEHYIVGGQLVKDRTYFAYQISLRYGNRHFCGGTIIDKQHIVTASHCCFYAKHEIFTANSLKIYAGDLNLRHRMPSSQEVEVQYIFTHKDYDSTSFSNDIALLRLKTNLTLNKYVKPANLSRKLPSPADSHCVVSGWGKLSENSDRLSEDLNYVAVAIISQSQCDKSYPFMIQRGMFCAGDLSGGTDSCQGDSGGPLVCEGSTLVGIVSWGRGCARKGSPGVYTDVSEYLDWIDNQKLRSGSINQLCSIFNTAVMFILNYYVFSK